MAISRSSATFRDGWTDSWTRGWRDRWDRDWNARPRSRVARATRAALHARRSHPPAAGTAGGATATVQLERPLRPAEAARVARAAGARLGVDPAKLERLLLRRGTRDLTRPVPEATARRVVAALERAGAPATLAPGAPRPFADGWGRGLPDLPAMAVTIWGGLSGVALLGWLLLAGPGRIAVF